MAHELQQRVSSIRQTWNRCATVELACWGGTLLAMLLFVAGGIDYSFRLTDTGLRLLLTASFLAVAGYGGSRLVRSWGRRCWDDFAAASCLQHAFPPLGDRLASSLEFLQQEEQDPTAGSAALRRSVVAETVATVQNIPLHEWNRAGKPASLRRAMIIAGGTLLVLIGCTLVSPSSARTALLRLALPWGDAEWPRQNNLAFVDPPPLVARGDTFEVSLIDQSNRLPEEVRIEYRYQQKGHRRTEEQWMQRVGDRMVAPATECRAARLLIGRWEATIRPWIGQRSKWLTRRRSKR